MQMVGQKEGKFSWEAELQTGMNKRAVASQLMGSYDTGMGIVINTRGTMEDDSHLTLSHPLGKVLKGTLDVQIRVPEASGESRAIYPASWRDKTPQQRAEEFARWVETLPKTNAALSDYAVSRESIYD
jgi:hypothetical protein